MNYHKRYQQKKKQTYSQIHQRKKEYSPETILTFVPSNCQAASIHFNDTKRKKSSSCLSWVSGNKKDTSRSTKKSKSKARKARSASKSPISDIARSFASISNMDRNGNRHEQPRPRNPDPSECPSQNQSYISKGIMNLIIEKNQIQYKTENITSNRKPKKTQGKAPQLTIYRPLQPQTTYQQ